MKVGLVVRADDGGLGNMTWDAWRHLQPDRTLVVRVPGQEAAGKTAHLDRFPGATVVEWAGRLDERTVRRWLSGADVVWTSETTYDPAFADWCRAERVRSVCHVQPEYAHCLTGRESMPDVLWAPTSWLLDRFPAGTPVVPVPVALDRFPDPTPPASNRVIFPVGRRAAYDRAGEAVVSKALARCQKPVDVSWAVHGGPGPRFRGWPAGVRVGQVEPRGEYWEGWREFGVCVLPRRYAGLSLPIAEAAAAGLALVLPASSPHEGWPGPKVAGVAGRSVMTTAGWQVPTFDTNPPALARTLDRLVADGAERERWQRESRAWAEANSWEALRPRWVAELVRAVE